MKMNLQQSVFEVRPYKLKELINLYGVSRRTLLKWLKYYENEIGVRDGHYYNITQVRKISQYLSLPGIVN